MLPDEPEGPIHWEQTIKGLKSHSARGADAIAASELQALPSQAIADLCRIVDNYGQQVPCWLMLARTTPKQRAKLTPGDIYVQSLSANISHLKPRGQ